MRQGQQNRRGRGRNRKGQNPLVRSFESNGPDMKIRGTPAHIAEKYMSLARDAQASGDPVLAENYFQHAEHYNRIIMAAREQHVQQSGDMMNGGAGRFRPQTADGMESDDDFGDEEGGDDVALDTQQPQIRGQEPQPRLFDGGVPARPEDQPQHQQHPQHRRRPHEHGRPPHRDRFGERRGFPQERAPGDAAADGEPGPDARGGRHPGRRERFVQQPRDQQPEFLRRPVRRPRSEGNGGPTEDEAPRSEPPTGDRKDE